MKFEKLLTGIGALVLGAVLIAFFAVLGGTIVWLIWPIAVPAAFPKLVELGYLAPELGWWSAVCLCWLAGILIKSSNNSSK